MAESEPGTRDQIVTATRKLIEDRGIALRGLFVIDPEGVLRYKVVHDLNIGRSAEETLRVIQALQTGGLCQAEWRPGQETIKA